MDRRTLAVFENKEIRKTWHKEEWWFVVEDVVGALTDSTNPKQYLQRLKLRDQELAKGYVQFVHTLAITTPGGPQRMSCANTEGLFRIIQSIPSKKAEPFKLWLAKVGYERIQEIDNPELAQTRMAELYREKGYSDEWIDKRLRGIVVRHELTKEWKARDVDEHREFAILTNEISKAAFGKTVEEYKQHKGLGRQNLRDHMNDLELIFTMLGEKVTTEVARAKDAQGFVPNKQAAKEGGEVAGSARKDVERRIGRSVVTNENYIDEPERVKRKRLTKR